MTPVVLAGSKTYESDGSAVLQSCSPVGRQLSGSSSSQTLGSPRPRPRPHALARARSLTHFCSPVSSPSSDRHQSDLILTRWSISTPRPTSLTLQTR